MGILIGYSNVGYRVILNNRVIIVKHVDILEEDVRCIGLDENESGKENDEVKSENDENFDNESLNDTFESMNESMDEPAVRTSERTRQPPKKFDDYHVYNTVKPS